MTESILPPSVTPVVVIVRRPVHVMLAPFAVACLVGTLATDIAYASTANTMWADFSTWLVTSGLILAVVAAIAGLFDFFSRRLVTDRGPVWPYVLGNILVLILAPLNTLVHTHDAWTSVMPWGLNLSIFTTILILVTGWMGWWTIDRYRIGVSR